jgi:hypothetical protein
MAHAMLVGAGVGAATGLATGQSPWKGALMGAATGGIGSGLTSAGSALAPSLTATELATTGLATMPAATAPSILGGEMLGSGMMTGMSNAGAISSGAFNPGLLGEASQITANAMPSAFELGKRQLGTNLTDMGNAYNRGLSNVDDFFGISEGFEGMDFGDKLTIGKMGLDAIPQEERIEPNMMAGFNIPKPQPYVPQPPEYLNTIVPNFQNNTNLAMDSALEEQLKYQQYKQRGLV